MKIDVKEFAKPCICGKEHRIEVKDILIEPGALKKIPELLAGGSYGAVKNPVIICDQNTYQAAGREVEKLLNGAACVCLNPQGLHADENTVALVEKKLPETSDLLMAVGSGTIHDITRYCSNQKKVPFLSIPTAASVDGFVSTVAAMTWYGYKKTIPAVSPVAVIADSTVFANAPYRLTASGVSDLLGKYTALADWKIAHVVTGEYLCNRVCELENKALREVCAELEGIHKGNLSSCEKLMYALLLSGLAMQMVGNSRPASGAEHHFSHLWEMEAVNPHTDAYHGEKVSVGLLTAVIVYHHARKCFLTDSYRVKPYQGIECDLLRKEIHSEQLLKGVFEENATDPLAKVDADVLKQKIPEITQILSEIPSVEEIKSLLHTAECAASLSDIGLSDEIGDISIRLSPYVRNRLTFMRLLKLFELD